MKTAQISTTMSDEDLVKTIVSTNNTLLFEVLYDRYAKLVFNKCLGFSKSKDEAEDLAQDIFLKLFVKLNSFKAKSKFSTWLYAFTYNHCVNYVNRNNAKKIERHSVNTFEIRDMVNEDDYSVYNFKVEKLKKALELISPEEKMILLLKYQDFLSIKDLEGIFDAKESAIKMRIKRAKEKLINVYTNI